METVPEDSAAILDKSQSPLRWFVLFLGCLIMIANYYCYDNPAALITQVTGEQLCVATPHLLSINQIDDYMGNPSDYETLFSLLYTGEPATHPSIGLMFLPSLLRSEHLSAFLRWILR